MACTFEPLRHRVRCPHQQRCHRMLLLPCNFKHNPDELHAFWLQLADDVRDATQTCRSLQQLVGYLCSPVVADNASLSQSTADNDDNAERQAYAAHLHIELGWSHRLIDKLSSSDKQCAQQIWYSREQKRELEGVAERARERLDAASDCVLQLDIELDKVIARLRQVESELDTDRQRTSALTNETSALSKQVAAVLPETTLISLKLSDVNRESLDVADVVKRSEQQAQLLRAAIRDEARDLHDHKQRLAKSCAELQDAQAQCQIHTRKIMDINAQSDFVFQERTLLQNRAEAVQCDIDTAHVAFTSRVASAGNHQAVLREATNKLTQIYHELKEKSELLRWSRREMRENETRTEDMRLKYEAVAKHREATEMETEAMQTAIEKLAQMSADLQAENEVVEEELRKAQLSYVRAIEDRQELEQFADELRSTQMAHLEHIYFNNQQSVASSETDPQLCPVKIGAATPTSFPKGTRARSAQSKIV